MEGAIAAICFAQVASSGASPPNVKESPNASILSTPGRGVYSYSRSSLIPARLVWAGGLTQPKVLSNEVGPERCKNWMSSSFCVLERAVGLGSYRILATFGSSHRQTKQSPSKIR